MSKFEKILIPLIDNKIQTIDLTTASGFIDSYTSDPDHPNGDKELYLVYDDRIRNKYVTDRCMRFDSSRMLKRKYVKIVKNIPYYIYVFWVGKDLEKSYGNVMNLTSRQKLSVLQFWGFPDDLVDDFIPAGSMLVKFEHEMPLEDEPAGFRFEEDYKTKREAA